MMPRPIKAQKTSIFCSHRRQNTARTPHSDAFPFVVVNIFVHANQENIRPRNKIGTVGLSK